MDNPNFELSPTDLPHLPLLLLDNLDLIPSMGVALRSFTASIILLTSSLCSITIIGCLPSFLANIALSIYFLSLYPLQIKSDF